MRLQNGRRWRRFSRNFCGMTFSVNIGGAAGGRLCIDARRYDEMNYGWLFYNIVKPKTLWLWPTKPNIETADSTRRRPAVGKAGPVSRSAASRIEGIGGRCGLAQLGPTFYGSD